MSQNDGPEPDDNPALEVTGETELDLLANQTSVISRHLLSETHVDAESQQLVFVQFLRLIKTEEQLLSLSDLFSDFEVILTLHNTIDILDENDPLGRQSLENSAKKTMLLLDAVTRILNNILRVKPEVHYIKETHRLRKSTPLPVEEYYRVKSPELDLIKAYTNFDQLKMLLINSLQNRQLFDLLEGFQERVLPQFKEFLKGQRRREATNSVDLPTDNLNGNNNNKPRQITNDAEMALRQTILSLTSTFMVVQSGETVSSGLSSELSHMLKEVYRALNEFLKMPSDDLVEDKARSLQKLIEQNLLSQRRTNEQPSIRSIESSFLFDFLEYLTQAGNALDSFFEHQSAARLEDKYFKRLEIARNTIRHVRTVMKEEHYHEKAQLPFLNLKSFIYFAVKVIKDLNYFNPTLQRKYRYYIERSIIDKRLQEAFRQIPRENRIERRYVIPALLELNRLMRLVSRISPNKDEITDYQLTYYWFKQVEQNLRDLIVFLKSYPGEDPLASRFDSISFTLEVEAERVFGKRGHLIFLNENSPLEEYIKRVEDSIGILGRLLQENYLYIAQAYLPSLTREDLDKDHRERIFQAIQLREHTWCIWQVCIQAQQLLKDFLAIQEGDLDIDAIDFKLNHFLNGLLRRVQMYLMKFLPKVFYSDRVELKRTFNDLYNCAAMLTNRKGMVTTQHLQQLCERIHVLTTLFASLAENIKNRSILEGKPFDEDSARRVLLKYLQAGERL